jgi:hypothetical protein
MYYGKKAAVLRMAERCRFPCLLLKAEIHESIMLAKYIQEML